MKTIIFLLGSGVYSLLELVGSVISSAFVNFDVSNCSLTTYVIF